MRIAQISFSFNGAFWPKSLTLLYGKSGFASLRFGFMGFSFDEKNPIFTNKKDSYAQEPTSVALI